MDRDVPQVSNNSSLRFEEEFEKFPVRTITTNKGRSLEVRPGFQSYNVFDLAVSKDQPVFAITEITYVRDGWFHVANVGPQDVGDYEEYVGKGVGTQLYDIVEEDIRSVGGKGLLPDFGGMSPDARTFWEKRIKIQYNFNDQVKLEELLDWHIADYAANHDFAGAAKKLETCHSFFINVVAK